MVDPAQANVSVSMRVMIKQTVIGSAAITFRSFGEIFEFEFDEAETDGDPGTYTFVQAPELKGLWK